MTVEDHTIVSMCYELRKGNRHGPVMEVMNAAYPFIFFYKSDTLLASFQENIHGLEAGEAFEFTIPSQEAYGAHSQANVVDIPIERFVVDDEMADSIQDVGQYVAVTDDGGKQHNGIIVEKQATHLKVDLNHVMAGKDLHFTGQILHLRAAMPDEIIQKRYIMPDGIRF
ncbi:MAG: FKBP-type peptidyl-prolyl cis-trans isomerase [Cyclobacteriaceae bacterium]